jgi:hypothetical protein
METVQRFDVARLTSKAKRTSQGFLQAPAYFTRAGVFEYTRADGTTVRELRPEDEVFQQDSLDSLSLAPLTIDHPTELVSTKNVKSLSVGFAGERIARKDSFVEGTVTVIEDGAIQRLDAGELKEISAGYTCAIDPTSGHHPKFGRYDQVQRSIKYNHLALLPENMGRAGNEVKVRLDGTAAILKESIDSVPEKTETRVDSPPRRHTVETEVVKIKGVEYAVEKSAAQAMQLALKEHDALQGRFDAKEADAKRLADELALAKDPVRLDSAVTERLKLVEAARGVLGKDAKIEGTKRQIMELVLKHDAKDLDLGGKSDEYVEARFDAKLENLATRSDTQTARIDALDAVFTAASTGAQSASEKARQAMIDRNRNAWKGQGN